MWDALYLHSPHKVCDFIYAGISGAKCIPKGREFTYGNMLNYFF